MKLKLVARTITYNQSSNRVLLVRNEGVSFWYAPGGGWEYERETIQECAKREVFEETGLRVNIKRLLYVQEFHEAGASIFFETFWLAEPASEVQQLDHAHRDLDSNGKVAEARWFSRDELQGLKVFPERLKTLFWEELHTLGIADPFIGVS